MARPLFVLIASEGGVRSGGGSAERAGGADATAVADAVGVALPVLLAPEAGAVAAGAALGADVSAGGVSDFFSH